MLEYQAVSVVNGTQFLKTSFSVFQEWIEIRKLVQLLNSYIKKYIKA